jgi:hypothetical protein
MKDFGWIDSLGTLIRKGFVAQNGDVDLSIPTGGDGHLS